jgi:hypothetical protein
MSKSKCQCGQPAAIYAMDTCAGGWAGYYCWECKPRGWMVTDVVSANPAPPNTRRKAAK